MKIWPVRRKNRELPTPEALALLREGDWGVLSIIDSDGSPYGVPINYVFDEKAEMLVFHGALEGRKWAWASPEPEACFTVVTKAEILPGQLTTAYASVMVFGTLARVTNYEQVLGALRLMASRCQPMGTDIEEHLVQHAEKTAVAVLKICGISGKRRDGR